jgi:hypothetical protein
MAGNLAGGSCTIERMRGVRDQPKRHEASNPCRSPIPITELAEILNRS